MSYTLFERIDDDRKATTAGTHRALPLEETLARARALMLRAGITRLADVTGLDVIGVPVYVAHRPLSRSLSVSQGKGLCRLSAQVSALMESLETWAAETIETPLTLATAADLDATSIVDKLELRRSFSDSDVIPWLPAWNLAAQRWSWLPYELATMDMVGMHRVPGTFVVGSGGLASGNHRLEAVLHGIYEVIEHHNCEAWRAAGERPCRLDDDAVPSPAYRRLCDAVRSAGVQMASFVVSESIPVPTFCTVVWDDPGAATFTGGGIGYGYGSHVDAEVALLRAATEALQSRLTYITGTREDMSRSDYAIAQEPERAEALQEDVAHAEVVPFDPRRATDTFSSDLADVMQRLTDAGFPDVFAFDLSKPELELWVAKVVIPGTLSEGSLA